MEKFNLTKKFVGLMQQNQTKVNDLWTLKVLYNPHFTVSIPIAYEAKCKTRKLYGVLQ